MATTNSIEAYRELENAIGHWFHEPDLFTVRASLAVAAALDIGQSPTWLMIVGPPSTGKTALHFPILRGYPKSLETSDINVPGLLTLHKGHRGEGILNRLGVRGLWLIKDFGSVLGMRDEQRNALLAAMREIYDGKYQRDTGLGGEGWVGRINIVAASTAVVENYSRVNAELGDRFLTIRIHRTVSFEACRKASLQTAESAGRMRTELETCGRSLLRLMSRPTLPEPIQATIHTAAQLISICRTPIRRDYGDEIHSIGQTEGSLRLYQELAAVLMGDAALHGQDTIGEHQLPLLHRLTFDTIPLHRGNILRNLPRDGTPIQRCELLKLSGERWSRTLTRGLEELESLNCIEQRQRGAETDIGILPEIVDLLSVLYPSG